MRLYSDSAVKKCRLPVAHDLIQGLTGRRLGRGCRTKTQRVRRLITNSIFMKLWSKIVGILRASLAEPLPLCLLGKLRLLVTFYDIIFSMCTHALKL